MNGLQDKLQPYWAYCCHKKKPQSSGLAQQKFVSCGHALLSVENENLVGCSEGTILVLINLNGNTPCQWAQHVVLIISQKMPIKQLGIFYLFFWNTAISVQGFASIFPPMCVVRNCPQSGIWRKGGCYWHQMLSPVYCLWCCSLFCIS